MNAYYLTLLLFFTYILLSSQQSDYCGTSWGDANTKCGTPCPSGTDAECAAGEHCYGNISCTSGDADPAGPNDPPTGNPQQSSAYCGTSWDDANTKCGTACPSGTDAECAAGEHCFGDISCTSGGADPSEPNGPTPPGNPQSSSYCGMSWDDANTKCGTPCPSGTDAECGAGEHCYGDISCTSGGSGPVRPNDPPTGNPQQSSAYCGTSWDDANTKCGTPCPSGTDAECGAGKHCYGDITCTSGGVDPAGPKCSYSSR
eukprot:TRINITY_DN1883_c0_g1_i1.p1 TRINITY_DN1883_c0_g1~~TRINITY_DN1883_c0_g1_i1.p1  ORF type:complete len:258 (+),score=54.00 TRINITY_DN1883_c0_g1_i1:44-817(+)